MPRRGRLAQQITSTEQPSKQPTTKTAKRGVPEDGAQLDVCVRRVDVVAEQRKGSIELLALHAAAQDACTGVCACVGECA